MGKYSKFNSAVNVSILCQMFVLETQSQEILGFGPKMLTSVQLI